jgi:hypothetical protein
VAPQRGHTRCSFGRRRRRGSLAVAGRGAQVLAEACVAGAARRLAEGPARALFYSARMLRAQHARWMARRMRMRRAKCAVRMVGCLRAKSYVIRGNSSKDCHSPPCVIRLHAVVTAVASYCAPMRP